MSYARPCAVLFAAMTLQTGHTAEFGAYELNTQIDLRAVVVDTPYESFTEGGLGLLRFDESHDGLRLGRAMLNARGPLTETLWADLTLSATGDHAAHAVDLTEASVEWRPYPRNSLRFKTQLGAFYPPISLENRAIGWQSAYSLSPSAINTWIGEEIRTIGLQQSVTLRGAAIQQPFDVTLTAGVFGYNDPMGVLIFQRGWALHDRQTTLFDGLPRPFTSPSGDTHIEFFREIDHRPGYYVGAEYRYQDRHAVRALHYDNRGDPAKNDGKDSAWRSRFDSIGWRSEFADTTLIAQAMLGDTAVGASTDGRGRFILEYWSYFILASQRLGAHRFTARYDRMYTDTERGATFFDSDQTATAWTAAYLWDIDPHWQFAVEAIEIDGSLRQRAALGQPTDADERLLQLAIRLSL